MEEKKRVRPTVAQVREMEEVIHQQCVDLNGWREKYRELVDSNKILARCAGDPVKIVNELRCKNETLEKSNLFLEQEISRLRDENDSIVMKCKDLCDEVISLKHRGFWSRLFNR